MRVAVRRAVGGFTNKATNVCSQRADCGVVITVGWSERLMRRKDCGVKWTVDGEKPIMIRVEWEVTESWWKWLWVSKIVKGD